MVRALLFPVIALVLLTPCFALGVTLKADFTNDAKEERTGTLDWYIEPASGGASINATKYCLQSDASSITILPKGADGKSGTAHKECTITDPLVLKESAYYTYSTLTYRKGNYFYTYLTEKSTQFSFGNVAGGLIGGINKIMSDLFGKKTCGKKPEICDNFEGENFCFLTDPKYKVIKADDMITELAKNKDSKLIAIPKDYEARVRAGCLPKHLDGYFEDLHTQSVNIDCSQGDNDKDKCARLGCNYVKTKEGLPIVGWGDEWKCITKEGLEIPESTKSTSDTSNYKSPKEFKIRDGKKAYLVTDEDWHVVLEMVPVAINPKETNALLVYVPKGIDQLPNSEVMMEFLKRYRPREVILVGNTPDLIKEALVKEEVIYSSDLFYPGSSDQNIMYGANLDPEIIHTLDISPENYFSFWESYSEIVYVENNYELALLASTYASLIDAPLVIQGTNLDTDSAFSEKKVICVGKTNRACDEKYSLEELRAKYLRETGTDKLILINTRNLESDESHRNELSLLAPILASAKGELVLSTRETDMDAIDRYLDKYLEQIKREHGASMKYLTIISGQDIPNKYGAHQNGLAKSANSADSDKYADTDGDGYMELAVGRIYTLSLVGTSSYIARAIFYDKLKLDEENLVFRDFYAYDTDLIELKHYFKNHYYFGGPYAGFSGTVEDISENPPNDPKIIESSSGKGSYSFLKKTGVYESSHGGPGGTASYLNNACKINGLCHYNCLPYLENAVVAMDACETCSEVSSICSISIERGAIAYIGSIGTLANRFIEPLYEMHKLDKSVGEVYRGFINGLKASNEYPNGLSQLMGDPTIYLGYASDSDNNWVNSKWVRESDGSYIRILGNYRVAVTHEQLTADEWIEYVKIVPRIKTFSIDLEGVSAGDIVDVRVESDSGCLEDYDGVKYVEYAVPKYKLHDLEDKYELILDTGLDGAGVKKACAGRTIPLVLRILSSKSQAESASSSSPSPSNEQSPDQDTGSDQNYKIVESGGTAIGGEPRTSEIEKGKSRTFWFMSSDRSFCTPAIWTLSENDGSACETYSDSIGIGVRALREGTCKLSAFCPEDPGRDEIMIQVN